MSFSLPPEPGGRRAPTATAPRRRNRALVPTLAVLGLLLLGFSTFIGFYTDLLWFQSVDYTSVFTTQLLTRSVLFVVFGAIMALAVAASAVIAYRTRPAYQAMSPEQQNLERYRQGIQPFKALVLGAVAALLALIAGSSAAGQWQTVLLWRNRSDFGTTVPEFGVDVSFFAFTLPFLRFLTSFGFAVVTLSIIAAVVVHYLYGGIRLQSLGDRTSTAARVQISVLAGLFVLLKAAAYWLDRYSLAVSQSTVGSQELVGLTYTDINAVLPAKTALVGISLVVAALFFANVVRRTWLLPALGAGGLAVAAVLAGGVYPAVVQYFQVRPSEAVREADFIERNIAYTRQAYDIDDVEITQYAAQEEAVSTQLREDADTLPGIRLLDPAVVSPTFQALQQIRNYYAFPDSLDIDRYTIDGETQDTVVAVREIDLERVEQRNWNNDHLVFTHGFGFVGARGNQRTAEGEPLFVESDIPPEGLLGEYEPRVYFGERSPLYSIVGAPEGAPDRELDFPDDSGTGQQTTTYEGEGGVPIGSFFNQLAYTVKFQEEQILLSSLVNDESRILYDRSPRERVEKVAPWLNLDGDPYPAIVGDRILWIVDGYTTTDSYPYSTRQALDSATRDTITTSTGAVVTLPQEEVNYIRNSVKATVDAYDGTVRLYAWDESDPVLQAWRGAFPGTVLDRSEISQELLDHLRYPEDLFKVQRTLLAQYHVDDPGTFYNGGDFWNVPDDPTQPGEGVQPPYYLTLAMPGQEEPTFSLTTTFVPRERPNLAAFAAVSAEPGDDYGRIRVLELPRNTAIPGPEQVQNNFDSNSDVATTLNLLARGETTIERGNLLTLPVGGGLLYVEPVYVRAQGENSFPLLRKVLVSFGDQIAFEDTLDEALNALFDGPVAVPDTPETPTTPQAPITPDDGADPPGEPGSRPGTPGGLDGEEGLPEQPVDLDDALVDAEDALRRAEEALADGDFGAYGEAQADLAEAIRRAVQAQGGGAAGAGGDAGGDGTGGDADAGGGGG